MRLELYLNREGDRDHPRRDQEKISAQEGLTRRVRRDRRRSPPRAHRPPRGAPRRGQRPEGDRLQDDQGAPGGEEGGGAW